MEYRPEDFAREMDAAARRAHLLREQAIDACWLAVAGAVVRALRALRQLVAGNGKTPVA